MKFLHQLTYSQELASQGGVLLQRLGDRDELIFGHEELCAGCAVPRDTGHLGYVRRKRFQLV